MIEIAMAICLTIMGIYFFKSTDLPKDMKERSAQLSAESNQRTSSLPKKLNHSKSFEKLSNIEINQEKLAKMSILKKEAELKIINDEIDRLTFTITSLEQELKVNNEKNNEIQKLIDQNLQSLQSLQLKVARLA